MVIMKWLKTFMPNVLHVLHVHCTICLARPLLRPVVSAVFWRACVCVVHEQAVRTHETFVKRRLCITEPLLVTFTTYIYIHLLALFNRWWCIDYTIAAGSEHYRSHSYHTHTHTQQSYSRTVCLWFDCVCVRTPKGKQRHSLHIIHISMRMWNVPEQKTIHRLLYFVNHSFSVRLSVRFVQEYIKLDLSTRAARSDSIPPPY